MEGHSLVVWPLLVVLKWKKKKIDNKLAFSIHVSLAKAGYIPWSLMEVSTWT